LSVRTTSAFAFLGVRSRLTLGILKHLCVSRAPACRFLLGGLPALILLHFVAVRPHPAMVDGWGSVKR
jgi:hypothetical protein